MVKTKARVRNHFLTILKWHKEDMERGTVTVSASDERSVDFGEMRNINMRYLKSLKDEEV